MKGLIAGPVAILAILYAGGYLAQFIGNYAVWKQGGGIPGDGTYPVMASPDFISCITTVFQPPYGLYGVLICIGLLAILLIMVMRRDTVTAVNMIRTVILHTLPKVPMAHLAG